MPGSAREAAPVSPRCREERGYAGGGRLFEKGASPGPSPGKHYDPRNTEGKEAYFPECGGEEKAGRRNVDCLRARRGIKKAAPERGGGREADGGVQSHRIRELQFMVPEFVDRMRGNRWQSALPTGGSNRMQAQPAGSRWNRALPGGGARPSIRRESCGFGDLGRFNLWRPMVVERIRGSRWNRALPGGGAASQSAGNPADSKTLAALIYGGQRSSIGCAVASGTGHCPAAAGGCRLSLPGH